jgi:quercetin dioxygenase-like cupin family protein
MAQPEASDRDYTLEDCIVRFRDLPQRRSTFRPLDMKVAKYDRERYSVVGRGAEGSSKGKKTSEVKDFSVVYLKLDPGKAVGEHAHDTSEVFIPLTGRWEVGIGGETTILEPFDVISVPPHTMHSLVNVSDEPAFLMAVNAGGSGAPIQWARQVLDEVRATGCEPSELERPPAEAR